jgi:hypothetical protein
MRKRTGYLVRPESSMRGGRSSIAFNSERRRGTQVQEKKRLKRDTAAAAGGRFPSLTITIAVYCRVLHYWGLEPAPGVVQSVVIVDDVIET